MNLSEFIAVILIVLLVAVALILIGLRNSRRKTGSAHRRLAEYSARAEAETDEAHPGLEARMAGDSSTDAPPPDNTNR
jgi:hypothetical protein